MITFKDTPLIDVRFNRDRLKNKNILITDEALEILNIFVLTIYDKIIECKSLYFLILKIDEYFDDEIFFNKCMQLYFSEKYKYTNLILYGGIIENLFYENIYREIYEHLNGQNIDSNNIMIYIDGLKERPYLKKICSD